MDIAGECLFTGPDGGGYIFPFFSQIVDNSWGTCVQDKEKNRDKCDNYADFTYFTISPDFCVQPLWICG